MDQKELLRLLHVVYFIIIFTGVMAYVRQSGEEPICADIHCQNNGSLNYVTCICMCTEIYTGVLCDTEIRMSRWPLGNYSLLSTVFGCPEDDSYGWHRGFINMTLPKERPPQQWKVPHDITIYPQLTPDPHILGPYYFHSLQLNFCTRLDEPAENGNDVTSWPSGSYCIFQAKESCPFGFDNSDVTLGGYIVTWDDTDGVLPTVRMNQNDSTLTLTFCCRDDAVGHMDLPPDFPFILLKKNSSNCSDVFNMSVTQERFDLVDDLDLFTFQGQNRVFKKDGIYQRIGLCYYEDIAIRECMYESDRGFSYLGSVNQSIYDEPCLFWVDIDDKFLPHHQYVGDFTENHCRIFYPWGETGDFPRCYVNRTDGIHFELCDIPRCKSDPTLEEIGAFKPVYSVKPYGDKVTENAVDGNPYGNPFQGDRPNVKPWIQVDLEEMFAVHAVHISRRYAWFPVNFRFVAIHLGQKQWDFFSYGSLQCDKRRYPRRAIAYRFDCYRPVVAQYLTVRNFDDPGPRLHGIFFFIEISEIKVFVKRSVCGRRLGLVSGGVRDFQLAGSDDIVTNIFDQGRLWSAGAGWCSWSDLLPYFMVDLVVPTQIYGLEIQGWMEGHTQKIIQEFTLEYAVRENTFTSYDTYNGHIKIFKVDTSLAADTIRRFMFHKVLVAKYIRLNITKHSGSPCLKMEIIGCPKRITRDLDCKNTSMDFGYEAIIRGAFWMEDTAKITGLSISQCLEMCDASKHCAGAVSEGIRMCNIYHTSRYNPHYLHWWITTMTPGTQAFMKFCVKEIKSYTDCDQLVTEPGIIESPSYPFYYGQLLQCTWTIVFPADKYVRVEVLDIVMAEPDTVIKLRETGVYDINPGKCEDTLKLDRLTITSRNETTYKRAVVISTSSTMSLTLNTCARYSQTHARGFMFKVSYSDIPGCWSSSSNCSTVCTSTQAIITSPGYPSVHVPPSSCRWSIQGTAGQYVLLTFKVIAIQMDSDSCDIAYVAVDDVSLFDVRTEINKYCSINFPVDPIKSSWQKIEIEFVSGEPYSSDNFMAEYMLINYVQEIIDDSTTGCDTWQRYGDNCYQLFLFPGGLTWLTAESQCNEHDGHLVSLASQQEVMFLHHMLTEVWMNISTGQSDFYIGLRKLKKTGHYSDLQWSDGSPVTYTSWYKDIVSAQMSQPDGLENERCSLIRLYSIHSTNNWHDVACAYGKIEMYICETEALGQNNVIRPLSVQLGNTTVPYNQSSLFECNSGDYILNVYRCDDTSDCYDASDEANCETTCTNDRFHCEDWGCIDIGLHCDFRHDCKDGSDETFCVYPTCSPDQWRCESGQCIENMHRCDVKHDCLDESDENDCYFCQESSFQCYDQQCVTRSRVCDGYLDCSGLFYEDEDSNCTVNTRYSCADWYSIGKRQNGSYLIDFNTNDAFEVECRFIDHDVGGHTVQTIVHHQAEAVSTWSEGWIEIKPKYTAKLNQFEILMEKAVCKQYFSTECSYDVRHEIWWIGKHTAKYGNKNTTANCSCPYVEDCSSPNGKCNCYNDNNVDWYGADHFEFRQDAGYVTNHTVLPIQSVHSHQLGDIFLPTVRITLGPLVCEEALTNVGISDKLVCANNDLAPMSTRCTMDFDEYGEVIGCRDLSHLQMNCDHHECQPGQTKCSTDGYCIPRRLLCDRVMHCPHGEDELQCSLQEESTFCPTGEIHCLSEDICVPRQFECDGKNHCLGGEDEVNCVVKKDKEASCKGAYHCHASSVCIELSQFCDGILHCPLADDEMLCDNDCPLGCTCHSFSISCQTDESLLDLNGSANYRLLQIKHSNLQLNTSLLSTFPVLNHLNVSGCNLQFLQPFQFQFSLNLIVLDLSYNSLKIIFENTFIGLHRLRILFLKGNPLNIIEVNAFKHLDILPELDLSNSYLSTINNKIFTGLKQLKKLNITGSHITRVKNNVFDNLIQLEVLDIGSNMITDFSEGIFNGLSSLQYLTTTSFILCCVRPEHMSEANCLSPKDEFSSCSDLMRNETLRAFLWIIGIAALFGNGFVLVIRLLLEENGLGRTYGIFVSNLSIADFMMGIYLIIVAIADTVFRGAYVWNDFQWRNGIACQVAGVLSTVASEGSVIFLCFITIDRLLIVKFPFGHVRISRKVATIMCIIAWISIFCIALIPILVGSYFNDSFYSRSAVCLPLPLTRNRPSGWEYSVAVFIVFNFLTFIVIASVQIVIYHEVSVSRRNVASQGRRQDIVIARKLFLVAITDFLCWFPVGLMGMLALNGRVISSDVYAWIAVFVLPINSALNPFLYTFGASTRKTTRKMSAIKKSIMVSNSVKEFGNITEVFDSKIFLFGNSDAQRACTISLHSLIAKRNIEAKEALFIFWNVAKGVALLHSTQMVHGSLDINEIYVKESGNGVTTVMLGSSPKRGFNEEEFKDDISKFGSILRAVLKRTKPVYQ